ncbi:hypothetical protein E2L08_08865 [Palleronia sediminis]|uniref:Uncharacterized protein n=1 Tax=Palleronia sediminis TaxID=2547833 RepID=A0A4R6A9X1_9RHOB|nr:hypothetical protein [Palleronia sediminis]TDL79705.1 hypothetical protein E2L08_08865 [Palleronia sediminis]
MIDAPFFPGSGIAGPRAALPPTRREIADIPTGPAPAFDLDQLQALRIASRPPLPPPGEGAEARQGPDPRDAGAAPGRIDLRL